MKSLPPDRPGSASPDQPATGTGPRGRLTERRDFLAAAKASKASTTTLTVQVRRRRDAAGERIGFTITKKTGTATERNRMRRRLREAARRVAVGEDPRDIVVIARRDVLSRRFDDLISDLAGTIRRAGQRAAEAAPHNTRTTAGRAGFDSEGR